MEREEEGDYLKISYSTFEKTVSNGVKPIMS